MFFIDSFQTFKSVFAVDNKVLVFPEMWTGIDWNDECYTENISKYARDPQTAESYPSEYMVVNDLRLFEAIKQCGFYTIFLSLPDNIEISYRRDFYKSELYDRVLQELVFVGWNPTAETGSAFTDGHYPIILDTDGRVCNYEGAELLNQFGLFDNLEDSEEICRINNHTNGDYFWFTVGLYVDKYTFERIKMPIFDDIKQRATLAL